jgi:DNA-binding CsgD family transcriptional regulator/DNA polymerase III delta prime subunit
MGSHPQAEWVYRTKGLVGNAFVGRQREMDELKSALEDTISGRGRLVMLVGEPGIGKTRTAQELASHAQTLGVQVLWGWCYEEAGAPPYWPWVQPLRSYIQQTSPDQLRSQMGPGAADIAEVISAVREKLPGLEPPPALEPEQARFRLFDSVTTFLKNATQSQPLVLVLDDLHWADKPSLLLLQFLARQLAESRLLVVGCYRDVELSRQHPLSETLAQLSRLPLFQRKLLQGLSKEDTERFIEATAGIRPPQSLAATIYAHTEGNPLFVKEVVRFLSERKELVTEEMAGPQDTRIPEGVREVIGQRLNRLSGQCHQALVIAAVIGRKFSLKELGLLVDGLLEDRLLDVVEEALAARLIEEVPGSTEGYQFSHALIQETLASELWAARRVRLHAKIAQALEELYGLEAEAHAAELAYHFAEAEPVLGTEKLVRYSLLAGERALATYAWEEALQHFQQGLAARGVPLTGVAAARDAQEAALLFGLGRAQAATLSRERLEEALTSLDRSFEYYADAGDVSSAVAVAEYPLPRHSSWLSKVNQRIERALTLVPPDSVAAGRLLPTYGDQSGRTENDYAKAKEAFERALAIARREKDVGLKMRTLAAWAGVDYFHLRLAESLEKSLQVVELARRAGDPHLEINGRLHSLQTLVHLGDSKNAEEQAKAGLALAERLQARHWLAWALWCGVNLYHFLGDWGQARQLVSRHLAIEPNSAPFLKNLVWLEYELGEFEQAEVYLKRLQEIMRQTPPRPCAEYGDPSLVSHFASMITGSSDYLEIAGQASRVVLSSPLANPFWIEIVRIGLALKAVDTKDYALAQEQYLALKGLQGKTRGAFICADRLMGLLAHTLGNLHQAAAHFEDARAYCRKEGFRPELAWTCHDYAAALLQRCDKGDSGKAESLLSTALDLSQELGMKPLQERVLRLQPQVESKQAQAHRYPAGLSRREVEVLHLVAKGKTNSEIAYDLVLSQRTVQRHISNIYAKINARNRAEATTFFLTHLNISP